jgi:hypothetical protein
MLLTITQIDIDAAVEANKQSVFNMTRICPIAQAAIPVFAPDVVAVNISHISFPYNTSKKCWRLDNDGHRITMTPRDQWSTLKPTTIEITELEP